MELPCKEWQGPRDKDGYGWSGRKKAHRVAYEEAIGPIPPGMIVCHHCDNPPCVEPTHLYVGTHRDNAHDRQVRGRQSRVGPEWLRQHGRRNAPGEGTINHKLTKEQVDEIRRLYVPNPHRSASPVSQKALAVRFGVSQAQISKVIRGDQWGEGAGVSAPARRDQRMVTPDLIATIKRRYEEERISQQALADEYGISQVHVSRIVRGQVGG